MSGEDFNQLSLKRSIEKVGQLYPVIVNQDGKILDGNHRSAEIKNPEKKIVQTKNRYDELKVRGNAHYRRRVPQEETRQLIVEMTNELVKDEVPKTEVAKRLFEDLPYSEGYILALLPGEFKEKAKVEAGKSAHIVEHTVKTQDMQTCEYCGIASSDLKPVTINSKPRMLCAVHQMLQLSQPEKFNAHFKHVNGESKTLEERLTSKPEPAFKETGEFRRAQMSPQISKMEEDIALLLQEKGVHGVVQQREFCLLSTRPDFYFPQKNLAVYIDGPVHEGKEDRDQSLRELLTKRHGVKVLSLPYHGEGKAEKERIVAAIVEA